MLQNLNTKWLQIHNCCSLFRRPGIIGAGALNNRFQYDDDSDEEEMEEETQTQQEAPATQAPKQG